MANKFSAVLFDVDGTLLDSTDFVIGAIEYTLRLNNLTPPSCSEIGTKLGSALADCYRVLAPGLDPKALCATHRAWQVQRVAKSPVLPYPHAIPTLCTLRDAGVRCGAVTARSKVSSLGTLEGAGLSPFLEVVLSAEDTKRTKPYPDPLFVALEKLDTAPSQAAFVGDTEADIVAGKAAGMTTVGALYGFFGESLVATKPDFLIRDIAELTSLVFGV